MICGDCLFDLHRILLDGGTDFPSALADLFRAFSDGRAGGLRFALHRLAGCLGPSGDGLSGFPGVALDDRCRLLAVLLDSGGRRRGVLLQGLAAGLVILWVRGRDKPQAGRQGRQQ